MRTTINIPDKYHKKIKERYKEEGYVSINDFILDLIRHRFEQGRILAKNTKL